eukprot:gb/GECG01015636.1/.p1 GENE.gb/GECG01015636.1/~~gb/GECG01015636.1/.p1  ORF type:complete len:543 (+),score=102.92 gb/GECG01015636.1/:1-1629(+)
MKKMLSQQGNRRGLSQVARWCSGSPFHSIRCFSSIQPYQRSTSARSARDPFLSKGGQRKSWFSTSSSSSKNQGKDKIVGQLPPFWGLNPNEEEKAKILSQKLPKEAVNIPHYMFFWGSEKDFLYRAARAFENATQAVFAPTSDVRAASVSSRREQQMMDPSQVMEDIFHYWLLSRAQSFRNSGARTVVELRAKEAQILQIDYFFVMQDDPEGSGHKSALPIHYDAVSNSYTSLNQVVSVIEALKLIFLQMKRPSVLELAREMYVRARVRFDGEERQGIYEAPSPHDEPKHERTEAEGPEIRYTKDWTPSTHVVTYELGLERASEDTELHEELPETHEFDGVPHVPSPDDIEGQEKPVSGKMFNVVAGEKQPDEDPSAQRSQGSEEDKEEPLSAAADGGESSTSDETQSSESMHAAGSAEDKEDKNETKETTNEQADYGEKNTSEDKDTRQKVMFTNNGEFAMEVQGVPWIQKEGWRIVDIDGHQPDDSSFYPFVRRAMEATRKEELVIIRSAEEGGQQQGSMSSNDAEHEQNGENQQHKDKQ